MQQGKYASGRRNSRYPSPAVGKLRVNILGSDKRPDLSAMMKEDSGLEYHWKGMQVKDHAGLCLQCEVVWILFYIH